MANITVYNDSSSKKDVAINHWGPDGSTNFYTIDGSKSGSWTRTDNRGFIMVVTEHNKDRKYGSYWYVQIDKDIHIISLTNITNAERLKSPF